MGPRTPLVGCRGVWWPWLGGPGKVLAPAATERSRVAQTKFLPKTRDYCKVLAPAATERSRVARSSDSSDKVLTEN